jgi:hypothetical protein
MATSDATATIFLTAFRALPKKEREAILARLLKDREFREDLIDTVIIDQRHKEPSKSLDAYLAERRKKRV